MAETDRQSTDAPGGWRQLLIPLIAVTVVGGGGGGFLGYALLASKDSAKAELPEAGGRAPAKESAEAGADGHGAPKESAQGEHAGKAHGHDAAKGKEAAQPAAPAQLKVRELPPVVANLGGEKRALVRIQSAIVYDAGELEHLDTLIPMLMSDITAFIGTLDLPAIEGPDGLRRLQEELTERAATRSERRIRELIIEALVVQ
jgi:flagellar FliL protein